MARGFMREGVVIVDNSALKYLEGGEREKRLEASLRAAGLEIWGTQINVLEASKAPPPVQRRLLAWLRRFTPDRPLLPFPFVLLERIAGAVVRGEAAIRFGRTAFDETLTRGEGTDEFRRVVGEAAKLEETIFSETISGVRSGMRPDMRNIAIKERRGLTARMWLDDVWSTPDGTESVCRGLWDLLEIAEPFDARVVREHEAWRMATDALGVAIFLRAVREEQQRNPVSKLDILQLIYPSVVQRCRIFVTDDRSLLEAATAVFRGRYPNIRAMWAPDFAAANGLADAREWQTHDGS